MSGSFNRALLAAILSLAIGRLACADTVDVLPAGSIAAPDVDAAFSRFSRVPQYDPPLQLALALSRDRGHATPQLSEPAREPATLQLTAQAGPLRPATLALAVPAVDANVSQFSRFPQDSPPLRLAFALNREGQRPLPQLNNDVQEPAAIRLTAQTRALHSATLARPQESVTKLAEQAEQREQTEKLAALPQKEAETVNVDPVRTWEIAPGDRTLNTTFSKWSASAGWQLVWDLEVDYPIETRAVLQGTFEEAVALVAQSLSAASIPIQATFYAGNKVLRIVAKGSK